MKWSAGNNPGSCVQKWNPLTVPGAEGMLRSKFFSKGIIEMKPWMMAGSTALALLYATGAVQAAVTPEDVWTNWQAMATSFGETITTASAARDGDALVVKGLAMSMEQDGGKASGTMDELRFTDKGDGTVEVTVSDSMTMTMTTPAQTDGKPPVNMAMTMSAPGMSMIASGMPDAISYALTAPDIKVHVEGADATDATKTAIKMDMGLTGTSGTFASTKAGAGQKVDYQVASKSAGITANVQDSTAGTDVDFKFSVADINGASSGMFLGAEAMKDMATALKAGFGFTSNVTYGAGSYEVNAKQADAPTKVSGTIGSGDFSVALAQSGFQFGTGSKDVTITVDSASIPIPNLSGSYGEAAFSLAMPLAKSDTPSDFSLLTKLVDLKISDALWGMIDAGNALPHDPATLIIDAKGTATLTTDLTDQAAMDAMGGTPPGQLNTFNVNQLNLKVAGAELKGQGAFTFDNTDTATIDGMPMPTGTLDLVATGVNGLIDKLVAMGLIPQDEAMQGKMMMGMFAKPGEGPDTLISAIEFKDKKMTINGMEMPLQ